MRGGSGIDDPCGGRRREPFAQPSGENEIGHVVEREVALQPVLGHLARPERRAGVVDQNIDARLLIGEMRRYSFHFRQAREIGGMATGWAAPGALLRSRASVASPRALLRPTAMMRAPILASASAATSPIPDVAPVMTTVLPLMTFAPPLPHLTSILYPVAQSPAERRPA